jgi:hypothetical protein
LTRSQYVPTTESSVNRAVFKDPGTHRYRLTDQGLRVALFFTRTHARRLCPKLADIFDPAPRFSTPLRKAFDRVDQEIKRCCLELNLAA